jgi:biopolymer transport protein ExbB/TolQ
VVVVMTIMMKKMMMMMMMVMMMMMMVVVVVVVVVMRIFVLPANQPRLTTVPHPFQTAKALEEHQAAVRTNFQEAVDRTSTQVRHGRG